ncbi:MAG: YkgJ family cysteine cluster protein [Candidatus Hinthialibacter antarcticus]|nr:YkgJ family cysteine cluster protein [Candidatus Hinthialibacter antarcticus]
MLTEITERELYNRIRQPFQSLRSDPSPALFVDVLKRCYEVVDSFIASLTKISVIQNIACCKGCSYCCSLPVHAHSYEIIAIAEHIKQTWSKGEISALKRRIKHYIEHSEFGRPFNENTELVFCPLLRKGSCSIHPLRPINCQAHHSSDVSDCIKAMNGLPSIIDFNSLVSDLYKIEYDAIHSLFTEWDWDVSQQNLTLGLKRALEQKNSTERYLSGERLFIGK